MVTDVLATVHQALHNKEIVSVELDWVKFITHWSRSAPGWYCGIKIGKKGPWGNEALRCKRTWYSGTAITTTFLVSFIHVQTTINIYYLK